MPDPRVSVVIAAFNREDSVRAAVDSVLEQTYPDLELIVVDDGSSDGTIAALEAISDPRLTVIASGENRGVSAARNRGIEAARGHWVAFHDSDDIWRPEKLAKQMADLDAPGADFVAGYCGMEIEHANPPRYVPDPAIPHRSGDIMPSLISQSFISTQTLIVRRDQLDRHGGFDEDLKALVDWELMLRIAPEGLVALVDEPLVLQRFSDNSITRNSARRVAARAHLVEKHEAQIANYTGALARHFHALAGGYRMAGDLDQARAYAARAIAAAPTNLRYRAAAVRLFILRIKSPKSQA